MAATLSDAQRFEQKGVRALRSDVRLCTLMKAYYLDEQTKFYAHKGLTAFKSDWTSVTEAAAMWRIGYIDL